MVDHYLGGGCRTGEKLKDSRCILGGKMER